MGEESSSKRRKVAAFAKSDDSADFCLAKDCIKLQLVSSSHDIQESHHAFFPTFLEEHFGESGRIYGYKGLEVNIYLHCSMFHAYADIKYDAVVPVSGRRRTHENVEVILKRAFGAGLVGDRASFLNQLASYSLQFSDILAKHAERITSWHSPGDRSSETAERNQIFRLELTTTELQEWHQRLNPLVLWFVEGASCIDVADPRWEVYVAVETTENVHKVTGFCNVYRFFYYPDSTRLRISQILVLPPYQSKRYGFQLVKTVNDVAIARNSFDVTMEDPSDKLQLLRDCMDVMRLLEFFPVISHVEHAVQRIQERKAPVELLPPSNVSSMVRYQFKISKVQLKRCWEVMILLHLDPADTAARRTFTELVSKRLCAETFEDKENHHSKVKHVIDTENEYDSSKTFVMMKFKQPKGEAQVDAEDVEDASEKDKALKELLRDRETQILAVAKRVASLLRGNPGHPRPQAWIEHGK